MTAARCEVCAGTGTVLVEGANGAPSGTRPCPMCSGRGNDAYVAEHREATMEKAGWLGPKLLALTGLLIMSNSWGWSWVGPLYVIHLLLWPVLIGFWIKWLIVRPPSRRQSKHAPGFTDDREKFFIAGATAAATLRGMWDQHERAEKK